MAQNLETPEGYELHTFDDIGLAVPAPEGWETWSIPEQPIGTQYYLSGESMGFDHERMLIVGMMVYGITKVRELLKQAPNSLARGFVELDDPGLSPISVTESAKHGPLQKFMRTYEGNARGSEGEGVKTVRLCGISNQKANTVYITTFETPVARWEQYKPVARMMIDGIRAAEGFTGHA